MSHGLPFYAGLALRAFATFAFFLLAAPGTAQAQTFSLAGIAFEESSYLEPEELQEVAARYINRPITFEDLLRFVDEVNGLYLTAGAPTAQAILPPQEIRDGVLRVALVEAVVDRVIIEGNRTTSEAFLRRNLSLQEGQKPDFVQLERDLILFDLAHDIRPRLSFGTGQATGTTDATIKIEEPNRFETVISVDNFGRPETGELRSSVFLRWNSVTGVRDSLSLQAEATEGARSFALGYSRPVGPGGGRLTAGVGISNSEIISGPLVPIDIKSDSVSATLGYRRPIRIREDSHIILDAGIGYERTESTTTGLPFADISINDAWVSAAYTRRFEQSQLSLSLGLRAGNADALGTSQTEGSFWLLYGQGSYLRPLGGSLFYEANLRYQYAPDQNLPVARLFSVGGVGSVRGYPNNIRSGDSGVVLNQQLSLQNPIRLGNRITARPFVFFDAAVVVPFRTAGGFDNDQDLLASVGAGVTISHSERFNLVAMVGVPLRDTLGFNDSGKAQFYVGADIRF
ncbi:Hemolysin activation/secretion protein [Roseovarius litoreus]|uniref:Hemolysin activation/secretion protein n=1 Tax=Roseovarius litoreus TaxID=1155722 RepID=A0A1M7FS08_9RHOB|nr:ShlB/FhaC/HecB family hemolysin secretion/activation protein [Roseovarius litoreus]SHM06912.1 Hemolysin activation/secretion protein [Roseovarius litoreus]